MRQPVTIEELAKMDKGIEPGFMLDFIMQAIGEKAGQSTFKATEGLSPEYRAALSTIAHTLPQAVEFITAPIVAGGKAVSRELSNIVGVPSYFGQSGAKYYHGGNAKLLNKYPDPNRMDPQDYISKSIDMKNNASDELIGANIFRGHTGYLSRPQGAALSSEDASELVRLDNNVKNAGVNEYELLDELSDLVSDLNEVVGLDELNKQLSKGMFKTDKSMYVTRQGDLGPGLLSTRVVNPEDTHIYKDPYFGRSSRKDLDNKIYKIPKNTDVISTLDSADSYELLTNKDVLKKAKSMDIDKYIELIAKGAAPFGIGAMMINSEENNAR